MESGGDSPSAYIYDYDSMGRLLAVWQRDKMGSLGTTTQFYTQDYDSNNRISTQGWQFGDGTSFFNNYTYNDNGTLRSDKSNFIGTGYVYDDLLRLVQVNTDPAVATRTYDYRDITDTQTTMQVEKLNYPNLSGGFAFTYGYDAMGNITSYASPDDGSFTYTYDNQGQLTQAVNGTTTYAYTYDGAGNLLTASNGGTTHTYTYGDADWKDLLTAYDNQSITYDGAGNPTSYYNGTRWNFTWGNGRRLETASNGTDTISYNYSADGIRTSKTVNGVTHTYYYSGTTLLRETYGDTVLDFFYDSNGVPMALKQNGTLYYYITNLQGDVIRLVDIYGNTAAMYKYDPYGNAIYAYGSHATINPLRYRGYYYDNDTGMYYLQSRYYDPQVGRFINADDTVYLGTGGLASYNLFAYCGNNPVMGYDPYGTLDFWGLAKGIGRIVTGIAAVATGVAVCVAGAPAAMIAAAAVTITAGVLTAVNGAADIQQSVTGNNFVRDTVFSGNQTAYNVYSGVTETAAIVGTTVCGNYVSNTCTMKGAVPGTEGKVMLEPGTTLDRYGSQYGRYLTDPGTSMSQLALTPGNSCNLTTYVVNRPFTFSTGIVAPCAWGPGGGVQYFSWMSVQRLVQFGILTPLS